MESLELGEGNDCFNYKINNPIFVFISNWESLNKCKNIILLHFRWPTWTGGIVICLYWVSCKKSYLYESWTLLFLAFLHYLSLSELFGEKEKNVGETSVRIPWLIISHQPSEEFLDPMIIFVCLRYTCWDPNLFTFKPWHPVGDQKQNRQTLTI